MLDGCAAATQIQRYVPVAARWNDNARGQALIVAAVIVVRAATLVTREITITHKPDIAAMAAINHNDVAFAEIFALMKELHESGFLAGHPAHRWL